MESDALGNGLRAGVSEYRVDNAVYHFHANADIFTYPVFQRESQAHVGQREGATAGWTSCGNMENAPSAALP
jgi:hypothetical protein